MPNKEFPAQHVWIYRSSVQQDTLSKVFKLAHVYSKAHNYWMPIENLLSVDNGSVLTAAELAIKELYHTIVKYRIPSRCIGAEWWVQVYEGGTGLAFHFDKDESKLKTENIIKHPEFSSILYLTGTDEERLRQACTVILNQRLDAESGKTVPESPDSCVFIPPTTGKFCVFDGTLGHGVLDSSNSELRATLLINWWTEKPKDIHQPTKDDLRQLASKQAESSQLESKILLQEFDANFQELPRIQQSVYPVIRIPDEDEDIQESGILVDDLLDSYLLDSFGVNSEQAICVRHKGHVLYPVDPLKTKQDISKSLIIPAAFIPEQVHVGP